MGTTFCKICLWLVADSLLHVSIQCAVINQKCTLHPIWVEQFYISIFKTYYGPAIYIFGHAII